VQRNIEAAASHVNSAQQGVDALRQYREARSSASDDANPAARSRTRSPNQGSSHVIPPVRQTSSADEPTRIVPSSTAPASTSASEKTGIKLQIGGESPDVSTERKDEGEVHDDANASRTTTTTTPPTTTTTATQ
jgi:hypothetical protein